MSVATTLIYELAVPAALSNLNEGEIGAQVEDTVRKQLSGSGYSLAGLFVIVLGGVVIVSATIAGAVLASPSLVIGGIIAGLVLAGLGAITAWKAMNKEQTQTLAQAALSQDAQVQYLIEAKNKGWITQAEFDTFVAQLQNQWAGITTPTTPPLLGGGLGSFALGGLTGGAGVLIVGAGLLYLFTRK